MGRNARRRKEIKLSGRIPTKARAIRIVDYWYPKATKGIKVARATAENEVERKVAAALTKPNSSFNPDSLFS